MACLVKMIEIIFVSLNPLLQYMFLKLHEIEDGEKKDFILETLLRKFKNEAIEARKIFDRFDMIGSSIDFLGIYFIRLLNLNLRKSIYQYLSNLQGCM